MKLGGAAWATQRKLAGPGSCASRELMVHKNELACTGGTNEVDRKGREAVGKGSSLPQQDHWPVIQHACSHEEAATSLVPKRFPRMLQSHSWMMICTTRHG
jgi:hypothetical protein